MKKVFAFIVLLAILAFNDSLLGMERNPLGISRTYLDDIQDNLPLLAQPDAKEFYEKMRHSFTVLFPNSKASHVRAWGEFFRRIIFQKGMGIRTVDYGNRDDIKDVLNDIIIDHKKASSKLAVLFKAVDSDIISTTLAYQHLDIFLKKLYAIPAFKTLKEKNSYGLFMDGFLDLIQGVQNNDQQKNKSGVYKLVLSAYGLNELAIEVLKKLDINTLKIITSNTKDIKDKIKRETFADFMKYAVDHQLFLHVHEIPYFKKLSDKQNEHVQRVMSSYFQTFCDTYYGQLDPIKQNFYKDLDQILRGQLVTNRDQVSVIKTAFYCFDTYIFPILGCVVSSYLLFLDLSDYNLTRGLQITGGGLFLVYTIYKVFQAIHTCWFAVHLPTYDEQQIRFSSLLLTYLFPLSTATTADSVGNQFFSYLNDNYDDTKTLSQNALTAFNGGQIK